MVIAVTALYYIDAVTEPKLSAQPAEDVIFNQ